MRTDVEWRKTLEDKGWTIRDGNGLDACREFDEFIRAVQDDATDDAADLVAELLEHIDEWVFDDRGTEHNECMVCDADGNKTDFKHAEGCKLKQLIERACEFADVEWPL
jgi:hypothetical protein